MILKRGEEIRRFLSILLALGLALSFSLVITVPAMALPEVWVDDVTDPLEDGSAAHPFDSIQEGINAADLLVGIVHVADGTYNENITLANGVAVLGAGASVTTINGAGGRVVRADSLPSTATRLDGFTVIGGSTDFGGGMYINASSPLVSNCVFQGNSAANRGGGMYINASSPTVTNCTFYNNSSGNQGGGIACRTGSSPTITNCIIISNTAANIGGGIHSDGASSPTITNNTIVGNTAATSGGGIYVAGASPTITNNIIVSNTATTSGGGIYVAAGTPTINYNDVWNNTGGDYSGWPAGANDISLDPALVGGGDYHLQGTSPCIDIGSNSAPSLPGTDFEGEPRIRDGDGDAVAVVDMGADEYFTNNPPDDPINLGPPDYVDGSLVNDNTPTLNFTQNDPDGDNIQYRIQIDDSAGFGSPEVDDTSALLPNPGENSFTSLVALPDDDYYWRVMSTDEYGANSGWTEANGGAVAFRLDTSVPVVPTKVGGEVHPINKTALLLPWLWLASVLILAGGLILIRRRIHN